MPASGSGSGLSGTLPYFSTYEIVRSMDHDGESFTQGLAFGPTGTLFESRGLYGNSAIRVLDGNDGRTLHEVRNTPKIFGEGLAVMGGTTIAQLSWREGTINEFNATDLSYLRATEQPGDMNEGWGLATDGRDASVLYASDGSNSLFHLATDGSYKVRRNLRAADSRMGTPQRFAGFEGGGALNGLNELEWVPVGGAGEVWANLYPMNEHKLSECIVRLDPATGEALGWIDMRGLLAAQRETVRRGASHYVLNGIAYDTTTDTLLVTGKQWDHIYQIRLVPHPAPDTDVREACFGTWDSFAEADARAGSGAGESGARPAAAAATTAAARADLSLADPAWAATGSRRATARRAAVDRALLRSESEI